MNENRGLREAETSWWDRTLNIPTKLPRRVMGLTICMFLIILLAGLFGAIENDQQSEPEVYQCKCCSEKCCGLNLRQAHLKI